MKRHTYRNAKLHFVGMTALSLILMAGCGGGNNTVTPTSTPAVSGTQRYGDLQLVLSTTKANFNAGENVPLTFTIKNVGTKNIELNIGTLSIFQFFVRDNTDAVIWGYPEGAPITEETAVLAVGQSQEWKTEWNQTIRYPDTKPAPAGLYTAKAYLIVSQVNGISVDGSKQLYATIPIVTQ